MKKLILSAAVFAAFAGPAMAQQATPASPHSFTGNVSVVSDYRFRGISQTFKQPAIQGGFDYAHSAGFYLGNWNSNVSELSYPGGADIEMDFYGGYKFEVAPDLGADVGVLYYYYPGARLATGQKIDNTEIYVGASYKWFSAKYSYAVSDFFGAPNTKGAQYLDLNAAFEVMDKTTLSLHAGRQKVKNTPDGNYTDWKIGLAYDAGFATLGLAYIDTNAKRAAYPLQTNGRVTKDITDSTVVFSVSKTF